MPRRGENIRKRKDGRWEGRYIKGRKPDRTAIWGYIYGHTYTEVKENDNPQGRGSSLRIVGTESNISGAFS